MSLALKYTLFKDAGLPASRFKNVNKKKLALGMVAALAVVVPLFYVYTLVGPQDYQSWSFPQDRNSQSSFIEKYASTPVPIAQPTEDYLTAR